MRVIVTLDPNKFAEKKQQPFDIGNQYRFKPKVALLKQPSRVLTCLIFYDHANNEKVDFPPDTTAFLYYSTSPEKPRIAGELRLRVTSRNDPASFESGSDLMLTNGQLWSRPLYSLSKLYIPLYEKLKEDRLLSDDLDSVLSNFPLKRCHYHRNDFHYTLNDTFTVDFSRRKTKFTVVTEQGVESLVLDKVFSDHRVTYGERRPYTGALYKSSLDTPVLIILMNLYRKCLGTIRTIHTRRAQRHKDHCATISQDNHTCEVCHPPL